MLEAEGVLRGSELSEPFQPLFPFPDAGTMTLGDPPERHGAVDGLAPFVSSTHDLAMGLTSIDEGRKGVHIRPDGHVQLDLGVAMDAQIRGGATTVRQAPHKSRVGFSGRVHAIQTSHELCILRMGHRQAKPQDIDLR